MAKRSNGKWEPTHERYTVRFYNEQWDELDDLREGPVSAVGVVRVLLDFTNERGFLRSNPEIVISRYRNSPYVSVEVYLG